MTQNITLSWRASLSIVSLFAVAIGTGILCGEWNDPGGALSRSICGYLITGGLLICGLLVASRFFSLKQKAQQAALLAHVGIGAGILVVAFVATLISYSVGFGGVFIVPTGLFLMGMVTIAKALN